MNKTHYAHKINADGAETIYVTDTDDAAIAAARYNDEHGRDASHTLPKVVSTNAVEVYIR